VQRRNDPRDPRLRGLRIGERLEWIGRWKERKSDLFARPSWQTGCGVQAGTERLVPDGFATSLPMLIVLGLRRKSPAKIASAESWNDTGFAGMPVPTNAPGSRCDRQRATSLLGRPDPSPGL